MAMCIHKARGDDLIGTVYDMTSSGRRNGGVYLRDSVSLNEDIGQLGGYMVLLAMNKNGSSSEEL
jgi:hypothetical protein